MSNTYTPNNNLQIKATRNNTYLGNYFKSLISGLNTTYSITSMVVNLSVSGVTLATDVVTIMFSPSPSIASVTASGADISFNLSYYSIGFFKIIGSTTATPTCIITVDIVSIMF